MANSTLSNLATRFGPGQAAAIAAAAGGTVVTSDITALAAVLTALSLRSGDAISILSIATTPAIASTMLSPG